MSQIFGLLQAAFSNGQVLLVSDEQCTMFIAVEGLHLVVTVTASSTVWRVSIRESEENPSIRAIESMTQDTFNHIVEVCATAGYTLHENGCLEVEVTVPPIDAASIGPRLSDMMATFRVNARKVLKVRVNMIIGQHLNGTGPGGVAQSHQPPTPPAAPVAVPVAAPHPPPPPPLADRLEKPTTLIVNRPRAGSSFLFEGEYDGRSAFVRVVDVNDENKRPIESLLSRLVVYTREQRQSFPVPRPPEAALEIDGFVFGEVRQLNGSFEIISQPSHEARHILVVMERPESAKSLTQRLGEASHEEFHEYPVVQAYYHIVRALKLLTTSNTQLLSDPAASFQLSPSFIHVYGGSGRNVEVALDLVSMFFPPAEVAADTRDLDAVLRPEWTREEPLLARVRYSLGMLLVLSFYFSNVLSFTELSGAYAEEVRSSVVSLLDEPPLLLSSDTKDRLSGIIPGLIDPNTSSPSLDDVQQCLDGLLQRIRCEPPTFSIDAIDRSGGDRDKCIRRIGRGGQANVFRAYLLKKRRFVALKELTSTTPDQVNTLRHEIRLLSGLNHDNVVKLYGVLFARLSSRPREPSATHESDDGDDEVTTLEAVDDGSSLPASGAAAAVSAPAPSVVGHSGFSSIYELQGHGVQTVMIMEYCPEGDLAQWLAAHHPTESPTPGAYYKSHFITVLQLLDDVVGGMRYLHDCKVLHRDLKPQNILLTRSGERLVAKIADFGIARPAVRSPGETDQSFTYVNVDSRGTLLYMAPELTRGRCTRLADVYSFAFILHDCLVTRHLQHKYALLSGPQPTPLQMLQFARMHNWRPMVNPEGTASNGYDPLSPWPATPPQYKGVFGQMMAQCWDANYRARPTFEQLEDRFIAIFEENGLPR